jgi:hypothetical protein
MPSSGEVGRGVTTSLVNDSCAATGFATAGLTEAALGAVEVFGAGFSGLAVLLVGGFCAFVSWEVMGLGAGGGGAALTTRPPRTTLLHPASSSNCSSEDSARVDLAVMVFLRPRSGARFARAALASFHFTQPR